VSALEKIGWRRISWKNFITFVSMIELSVVSMLLRQLLRTHDRVSLPGLGAFVVDLTSAALVKGGRAMRPPSKQVVFSSAETWNDGLLEQALAKDQGYTPEDAQKQMAAFSQKLIEQLAVEQRVELPELGVLRMAADKEWRFTPFETIDVDADSFGLLELEMTPLTPEQPEPLNPATRPPALPHVPLKPLSPEAEPPMRRRCGVICWVLIVLLLLIIGGFVFRRPIVDFIERSYYTPEQLEYLRSH
jgi:nucleoid DNA-binding protein